jgi:hypothetical protein
MKTHHRRFEIQCVLGLCGQLSEAQLERLREHAMNCCECRESMDSATLLNTNLLVAGLRGRQRHQPPKGMLDRFIARANGAGIPVKPSSSMSSSAIVFAIPAAVCLILILAFFTWRAESWRSNTLVAGVGSYSQPAIAPSSNPKDLYATPQFKKAPSVVASGHHGSHGQISNRRTGDQAALSRIALNPTRLTRSEPIFANPARWMSFSSVGTTPDLKYVGLTKVPPAPLSLMMQWDSNFKSASLDMPTRCASGTAPIWNANFRNDSSPPDFCFDPQLAFMADSTIPTMLKGWRNRSAEMARLPVFQFTPDH